MLSTKDVNIRYPGNNVGVYAYAISSSLYIDSALSRGIGAYANAPPSGVHPNARLVPAVRSRSARIEITRNIGAGEEIFVSYGRNYWRHFDKTTYNTSNIPDWEWDLSDPFAFIQPVPAAPAQLAFQYLDGLECGKIKCGIKACNQPDKYCRQNKYRQQPPLAPWKYQLAVSHLIKKWQQAISNDKPDSKRKKTIQ